MFLLRLLLLISFLILQAYSTDDTVSQNYDEFIKFHWKGALTSNSIILKVFPNTKELKKHNYNVFLAYYNKTHDQSVDFLRFKALTFSSGEYPVAEIKLENLEPSTEYFYSFIFSSTSDISSPDLQVIPNPEFSFKTFQIALTPANFTFGLASCAPTGSNSSVFLDLKEKHLDFFMHMGDFHYDDNDEDNVEKFYQTYHKVFSSPNQKAFFQQTPITYVWDDHDFGPNDAIGTSPSKPAATKAYKDFVPYYPLKNYLPSDDSQVFPGKAPVGVITGDEYKVYNHTSPFGIFRSFIVGRCLFIMMDLRSFLEVEPDDILGAEQKDWLENQIKYAGLNEGIKMVFVTSSFSWIHNGGPTFEEIVWSSHRNTQKLIADQIQTYINKTNKKIMFLCGDAHMLAFDDGRNNRFGGFPVVQAASLDKKPNCKGGPYSHGTFPGKGQYGIIEVTDANDTICVKINLMRGNISMIAYDTCHPELYPSTGSAKCHPTWGDFSMMMGVVCVSISVLVWCFVRRRKQQVKSGNGKQKHGLNIRYGYGYENMKEDGKGSEEIEEDNSGFRQNSKIEMTNKKKSHKGD